MSCKCFDKSPVCKPSDCFATRLNASKCYCLSRFTVQERKSKFIVVCNDVNEIDKYKIDGHFDTDKTHEKCDYLFCHHTINNERYCCVFVELKGTDINHAVTQIGETISRFSDNGFFKDKKDLIVVGAIVSTGYPANDASYRRLEKRLSIRFKRYRLRIVNKKYEIRYIPETGRFIGKGEK